VAATIASGTAVASPGHFGHIRMIPLISRVFRFLRLLPRVHQSFLAAPLAPLLPLLPRALLRLAVNVDNVEPLFLKRALCHLISDMTRGESLQFSDWIDHLEFRTRDGSYSYEKNFGLTRRPLFLVAGTRDYLASAQSVSYTYDRLPVENRKLAILGKRYGQAEDYGHGDLLIGRSCEVEVFPLIAEWLAAHDGAGAREESVAG
jgi:pimeloyl-ACP methyl ester carboxylesterase